jgi:hypothetical protein
MTKVTATQTENLRSLCKGAQVYGTGGSPTAGVDHGIRFSKRE